MAISTEQVKGLLQSSDIEAIRNGLDQIASSENSLADSATEQERVLKLQIMLQSRILALQQEQNIEGEELAATYRRVASLWMRSGETERAVGQLQKALSINKKDTETMQLMARAMLNLSKYDEAIVIQEKAIKLMEEQDAPPDDVASAYVHLASVYEAKGEFQQSIDILKKTAEKDGITEINQAEIYGKLGVIAEKIGEDQQAVEALTKAHALYLKTKGESHNKTQEVAYLLEMASTS